MKQAILEGIHVPNGTARDPWRARGAALRRAARLRAAPLREAPVWAACVAELAGLGYERTACARAGKFGRLRRDARFEPGSLVDSTQAAACRDMWWRLAEQDVRAGSTGAPRPGHCGTRGDEWSDAEVAALHEHVESDGPRDWALCAKRVSAVLWLARRTRDACSRYYRRNDFVAEPTRGGPGQEGSRQPRRPKARRPRRNHIARPASPRSSQAEADLKRLLKKLAARVEARLLPLSSHPAKCFW